jgi:hypothetical protein
LAGELEAEARVAGCDPTLELELSGPENYVRAQEKFLANSDDELTGWFRRESADDIWRLNAS